MFKRETGRAPLSDDALAAEMEAVLRKHVLDVWFPACIDDEQGGFHQSFDRQWRRFGDDGRMLEFQARQTRSLAQLAEAYPGEPRWREYALHGLRYLRDIMWDGEHGGWYWRVGADGAARA